MYSVPEGGVAELIWLITGRSLGTGTWHQTSSLQEIRIYSVHTQWYLGTESLNPREFSS